MQLSTKSLHLQVERLEAELEVFQMKNSNLRKQVEEGFHPCWAGCCSFWCGFLVLSRVRVEVSNVSN